MAYFDRSGTQQFDKISRRLSLCYLERTVKDAFRVFRQKMKICAVFTTFGAKQSAVQNGDNAIETEIFLCLRRSVHAFS